jgi:cobalamin synthase
VSLDAAFEEWLARSLWCWVTVLTLLLAMCAVFLARWWQHLAAGAGSFGAEFRQIRLGRVLGVIAAGTLAASFLVDSPFADDLARFMLSALALVGVSAAHRVRHERGANTAWLWAMYLLLIFVSPIALPLLAGVGFVDNWLRSGGRNSISV